MSKKARSVPKDLIAITKSARFKLFHTPQGIGYVSLKIGKHIEHHRIDSKWFAQYLALLYYQINGKSPAQQAVKDATETLQGRALFESPQHEVHTRIAGDDTKIYVDLCNDEWKVVEITAKGWRVLDKSPLHFRRAGGMQSLALPKRGGILRKLEKFINIRPEDWTLVAAWLVGALRPHGPYPVLTLYGEQGSAKSTTERMLRLLIDPNEAGLRGTARDERDLIIAANNSWIVGYDNLSRLTERMSDALCRISTGGGFGTRKLYEDADEILFDVVRPVILNGIGEVVTRSDLLERSIVLYLPPIDDAHRKTEAELWKDFERQRPYLVGALFDATVLALRNVSSNQIAKLPRMADFAKWGNAAELAFDCSPGEFLKTYEQNISETNTIAVESSALAQCLIDLLKGQPVFEGTYKELLAKLNPPFIGMYPGALPDTPEALSAKLRRLAPNLRHQGITITALRHTRLGNKVRIEATKPLP